MPRFPIPPTGTGGLIAAARGVNVQGVWPLPGVPPAGGPSLIHRWDLTSIYLPVRVATEGTPEPTVCDLTVRMSLSGELVWQQQQSLTLVPIGATTTVGAAAIFADSMPNPIAFRNGQSLQLGYLARVDQAANPLVLTLAAVFGTDPSDLTPQPSPGAIAYNEVADDHLVGAAA